MGDGGGDVDTAKDTTHRIEDADTVGIVRPKDDKAIAGRCGSVELPVVANCG